jgi:hypothetical protein
MITYLYLNISMPVQQPSLHAFFRGHSPASRADRTTTCSANPHNERDSGTNLSNFRFRLDFACLLWGTLVEALPPVTFAASRAGLPMRTPGMYRSFDCRAKPAPKKTLNMLQIHWLQLPSPSPSARVPEQGHMRPLRSLNLPVQPSSVPAPLTTSCLLTSHTSHATMRPSAQVPLQRTLQT